MGVFPALKLFVLTVRVKWNEHTEIELDLEWSLIC